MEARNLIPFAKDIDGTLLCLQIGSDGGNTVGSVDADDGQVTENLNQSYGQYLEDIRQKLLSAKLVYEEGLGLVSVA